MKKGPKGKVGTFKGEGQKIKSLFHNPQKSHITAVDGRLAKIITFKK